MMFARVDASPLGTGRFYTSDPRYQEADRLFHESIRYVRSPTERERVR